jgi:hypothetical protein
MEFISTHGNKAIFVTKNIYDMTYLLNVYEMCGNMRVQYRPQTNTLSLELSNHCGYTFLDGLYYLVLGAGANIEYYYDITQTDYIAKRHIPELFTPDPGILRKLGMPYWRVYPDSLRARYAAWSLDATAGLAEGPIDEEFGLHDDYRDHQITRGICDKYAGEDSDVLF